MWQVIIKYYLSVVSRDGKKLICQGSYLQHLASVDSQSWPLNNHGCPSLDSDLDRPTKRD